MMRWSYDPRPRPPRMKYVRCKLCERRLRLHEQPFQRMWHGLAIWAVHLPEHECVGGIVRSDGFQVLGTVA